jgi:hypothetical protein
MNMSKTLFSERFMRFARNECSGSSNLYEHLSTKISEDDELLGIFTYAPVGQPVPNLFLAAVHYLLLKGKDHILREFYPSITQLPRNIEDSFSHFKEFCLLHKDEIISILNSRLVQTNEVRRCAYLYPIFCYIYNIVNKPLSLIEVGTSAGLQLLWDKYSYSYGTNTIYGNKESIVHITSEVKGSINSQLFIKSPQVATKVGIDLHISDLTNEEDYLWLKSLIWPEHKERIKLFENAAKCFLSNPIKLIEGNGVTLLTEVIEEISLDNVICIFHTHVANQIPEDSKTELMEIIKNIGEKRDVFHVYNNMWDSKLHLDYFIDGTEYNLTIGDTDGHGRWFDWNLA